MQISVIIVDDHDYFRSGFADDIKNDDSIKLIAEAKNGQEGLELISKLKPDIAIIDIDLPEIKGLELTKRVKIKSPETNIIILTSFKDEEYFIEAMEVGVSGYFYKDETADLVSAMKKIHYGETVLSPQVLTLLSKLYKNRSVKENKKPDISSLTPRELEILKLISENKTSQEISAQLFIEKRTVETHRNNIREKLELIGKGSNALLVFAIQNSAYLSK